MSNDYVVGVLGRGIVAADEPVVRADDLGLSRGDGCFETCRVITAPDGSSTVDNLDAHLARLGRSLAALDIVADVDACGGLIRAVVDAWTQPGEAAVKLMVTRGVEGADQPTVLATVHAIGASALRQRHEGVRVITLSRGTPADAFADAGWLLGGVKSLSYALNMAALREAARRGAEDAIWVSTDGLVLEAPTATVVWRAGDRLLTTRDGATGILPGTTMAALFDGAEAEGLQTGTATITASELAGVESIWLVSSVRGIAEVIELDGAARTGDPDLTKRLQELSGF